MEHNITRLLKYSHNILLLQGPVGPFFLDFAQWLRHQGKTVFKLNFNGGDEYFYPNTETGTFAYRDTPEHFLPFLTRFCETHRIDSLICFGDTRFYHRQAKQLAKQNNLSFWAFEEGYFRPHYITLEQNGVNAYSEIPREAEFFRQQNHSAPIPEPKATAGGFLPMAKCALVYYAHAFFKRKSYPDTQHHRPLSPGYYSKHWLISLFRRLFYFLPEYRFTQQIAKGKKGRFFTVALQVHNDSQVKVHSSYPDIDTFLKQVLQSFAAYAVQNGDTRLIIKQHPMDRGFNDYRYLIEQLYAQHPQLRGRIDYVRDVSMPVLLRHTAGMVTLNSTSGISALWHNLPVITLGNAVYNIPELTHQGSLDDFWHNPQQPDAELFKSYHRYHILTTQINGNFYNRTAFQAA